jgi:small-conductance mechanosensitive channel
MKKAVLHRNGKGLGRPMGVVSLILALLALLIGAGGTLALTYWRLTNAEAIRGPQAPYTILLLLIRLFVIVTVAAGVAITGLVLGVTALVTSRRDRQPSPFAALVGVILNVVVIIVLVPLTIFALQPAGQ